jgi:iron complex transport system permease protein
MTTLRWVALVCAVAGAAILALGIGPVSIPPLDALSALTGGGDDVTRLIVRDVRGPRVVVALCAGAALAMSGATLQGVLRNPLAEPYLLGVSGGAAVGAVLVTAAGGTTLLSIAPAAFGGAAVSVFIVLALARLSGGRFDPRVLLMAGVVVGAFANATIMVALANADANSVRGALWWMMGSLGDATWRDAMWLTPVVALGGAALVARSHDVDALALGEDAAASLGVDVERAGRTLFLLASLLAAATVASAGLIGFVGLVIPALVRALGARRARETILGASLAGGALLIVADTLARTIRAPAELPVGAVTALVGVPFFLMRLGRLR